MTRMVTTSTKRVADSTKSKTENIEDSLDRRAGEIGFSAVQLRVGPLPKRAQSYRSQKRRVRFWRIKFKARFSCAWARCRSERRAIVAKSGVYGFGVSNLIERDET